MKKTAWLIFLVFAFACKQSTNTTTPVRRDITQAVYASGKIYPLNKYNVFTKLPGYVEKIHVRIGEEVKIGQPLITIKSEISDLNVNAAKNTLDLAQKNVNESGSFLMSLKANVKAAQAKYELDSLNYSRLKNLLKGNAASQNQYDQAQTLFDVSKQSYFTALNNYKNTKERVRTELENARIQYEAQVSNRNDFTISSVLNGKVYDIVPKEGELINTQIMLMEVGDDKLFEVELSVDETDISLIKKGQEIAYGIDAYKDQFFKGLVIEAYPRINQNNKTSKIIASILLTQQINVYSGMSVEANIIISEKKNALVIPREFLIDGKKVKIKSSGDIVEIKKGAEDLESVEILSGIDETTVIVKP